MNKNNGLKFFDFFSFPHNPEKLFTLLYLIGKNKNYEIYKAINNDTREVFCIKIISLEKISNEKENNRKSDNSGKLTFQKLKQESLIMRSITNYDNITQYYGSFFSFKFNSIWQIFEYCPAGSIFDLMKLMERPLTEKEISMIINDILHGLIHIHQLNITYRNLKATNILLSESGIFKLNNFSKSIQKLNNNELFFSKNKSIDKILDNKYDIFLLGITCIELFLGLKDNNLNREKIIEKLKINNNSFKNFVDQEILSSDDYNDKYISPNFIEFIQNCIEQNSNSRPTALEISNLPFIKNYYNSSEKARFIDSLKANIEKIENSKKENYFKSNRKTLFGNFYSSIYSNSVNTVKSNITINDKSSVNISNIGQDNIHNTTIADKITEFRIEQMKKGGEDLEFDKYTNKYTNKDLYSNIDNTANNNVSGISLDNSLKESAVFGKGDFEENKSYEKQKKSSLSKNLFKNENEDIKVEDNKENELNDIEEQLIKKNSEEIFFKENFEHLQKYEEIFKNKLCDNYLNYDYNKHILEFSEDSNELENNIGQNNENIEQNKLTPFSDIKCDVIQLGSSVQKISSRKNSNYTSEYSLKNSVSKFFENNCMDKNNFNNIQKKFLLSFGNNNLNEIDINKKNDIIKRNKNDMSTCLGSLNSSVNIKQFGRVLEKYKSSKQIIHFRKSNYENTANNSINNENNKNMNMNLDKNDINDNNDILSSYFHSERNKTSYLYKYIDGFEAQPIKFEIKNKNTNIIKVDKIFKKNKYNNNIDEKIKNIIISKK